MIKYTHIEVDYFLARWNVKIVVILLYAQPHEIIIFCK